MSENKEQASADEDDNNAASASASPRDKKSKLGVMGETAIPESQNARRQLTARDLLVAASPPKFISMEDVMRLANGMTDMALAHEIAVGKEFQLEEVQPDPNSLEGRIKDVMHKAFWDVLAESLKEDPPDYTHALVLLKEVKQGLLDLLLPHHQRLRATINEGLDLDLIEQQADHGALDFQRYATFVIDTMAGLCAPVRDELVASLRKLTDIVSLYREILEALKLLKMDLVNFTISQVRPIVQQHSVEYERNKFQSLLDLQRENGVDGLEFTRDWLSRAVTQCKSVECIPVSTAAVVTAGATSAADTSSSSIPPSTAPIVTAALNVGYAEILDWDDDRVFPETLLMDHKRFMELRDQVRWLTLVASVLIVTYSTVGAAISGVSDLKNKLTKQICLITKQVPKSKLADAMLNVTEQVNKDVNESLQERGFTTMKTEQQQLLKGQITAIVEPDNIVHRLMKQRLLSFISKVLSSPYGSSSTDVVQLPAGYSSLSEELTAVIGQFLRLVTYNKTVFGPHYIDIITAAAHIDTVAAATTSPHL